MDRTATCSCGQVAVTVRGDPKMHGICSCLECQKQTGSTFSHQGYWPKSAVQRIAGPTTAWRRSSDAGRWVDTHFCPVCGSAVYFYVEFDPDAICIAIGNFADPGFPPPQYSVWQRHKHPWIQVPAECNATDTQ